MKTFIKYKVNLSTIIFQFSPNVQIKFYLEKYYVQNRLNSVINRGSLLSIEILEHIEHILNFILKKVSREKTERFS